MVFGLSNRIFSIHKYQKKLAYIKNNDYNINNENYFQNVHGLSKKMKKELKIFSQYLKDNRLKNTSQRAIILKAFLGNELHLSAEDLYNLLKKHFPKIGFSTVYRTLKLLAASGLAKEVDLGDGKSRFEHTYNHEHHDHLICIKCGQCIETMDPEIEHLQDKLAENWGFTPLRHKLEIYGLCKKCKN